MDSFIKEFISGFNFIHPIEADSIALLKYCGRNIVAEHTQRVSKEAERLALIYGVNHYAALIAGCLHDISAIIPASRMLEAARYYNIELVPEEEAYPGIIHQKLSRVIAQHVFKIDDEDILSAIGCHTTLKAGAAPLDLVVFLADKLQWDQKGCPPYLERVNFGLVSSLTKGAYEFIKYQLENKKSLKVLHPWLLSAYDDLKKV